MMSTGTFGAGFAAAGAVLVGARDVAGAQASAAAATRSLVWAATIMQSCGGRSSARAAAR